MNWDAIGAGAELAGAVGVIVSLAYLATQIRSNTKALRGNALRETAEKVNGRFFASKHLLEAAVKVKTKDGFDAISNALMVEYDLTPEEAESYWRYLMQIWGGLQADFRSGVLDEYVVSTLLRAKDQELFWEQAQDSFSEEFVQCVQNIRTKT